MTLPIPWGRDPSLKRISPSDKRVIDWLCSYGPGSPLPQLMDARNKGFDRYDDSLAAAERFAEMMDGNYSNYSPWRSDDFNFGQYVYKSARNAFADGRGNGSKDAGFVAKWGALGAFYFEQGKLSTGKVLGAIGFLLFAWYTDILALQIPLFAYFVCPPVFGVMLIMQALRKPGWRELCNRTVLGFPVILLIASVFSVAFSQAHDQWLMHEVQHWGATLRNEKAARGEYPKSMVRSLHGYQAAFINNSNEFDPPVIVFHKFGQMRQTYRVPDDRFLEATES